MKDGCLLSAIVNVGLQDTGGMAIASQQKMSGFAGHASSVRRHIAIATEHRYATYVENQLELITSIAANHRSCRTWCGLGYLLGTV